MRDRDLCSDLVRGLPGRRRIEQVDLARGELWMAPDRLSPRQRDHVIALGEKSAGNRRADAGIAAAHDRRVLGYAHLPSHKELDVAEGSIAIDQVDALDLDLQLAVLDAQMMRDPGRIERLLVQASLDIMYRGPGAVAVGRGIARIDLRRLQHVMAAALRLLAVGSRALEPLDPDR